MVTQVGTIQPRYFGLGGTCVGFTLRHTYITDNLLLYVAPDDSFCRACFRRRYLSQMMQAVRTPAASPAALQLASSLDSTREDDGLWHVYTVRDTSPVITFELVPYEDCPVCAHPAPFRDEQAVSEYERRLQGGTIADYEGLRGRVFSFGFARRLTVDQTAGLPDPRYNALLGDNHAARVYCRLIESAGNHADVSTLGVATDKALAEKKSIMEYLERYAFLLNVCRYPTSEYDDQLIDDFAALYREPLSSSERAILRSKSTWAYELSTATIRPLPLPFLYCTPGMRFIRPTSSGFGAHEDFGRSLCRSIIELIERDAFVRFWHDPSRAMDFLPEDQTQSELNGIKDLIGHAVGNPDLACRVFLLQSPTMLPVVMITASSNDVSKPPSLCFGCGAGVTLAEAIDDAAREFRFNALNLVKGVLLLDGFLTRTFPGKIEDLQDRMNFYATAAPRARLRFLDQHNPLSDTAYEEGSPGALDGLIERFRRMRTDIYVADCTPACFAPFNVYVTRAFSTGMYPLQFQQSNVFRLTHGPLSASAELPHFFL